MVEQLKEQIPKGFKFRFRLEDHVGTIVWMSWSPDGRILASCSADETIDLWNPQTSKLVKKIRHHKDAVSCITWSPDSRLLASGSYDDSIVFADSDTGQIIFTEQYKNSRLNDLAWSGDTGLIAGAFNNGIVRIWDEKSYKLAASIEASKSEIYSIVWIGNGNFATSSLRGEIRLWNSRTQQVVEEIDSASQGVYDLAFSQENGLLAAGYDSGDIVFFETSNWKGRRTLRGHTEDVTCVRFSHDGRYLASKSFDDTVRLWEVDSGTEIARLHEPSQHYWLSGIAFHPKQLSIATLGDADTVIRVWDLDPDAMEGDGTRKRSRRSSSRNEDRPTQFPVATPPTELINALVSGECVSYVGSGLGAQAGLPTWNDFVQRLFDWGSERGFVNPEIADSLREALALGNSAQVADIMVSEIRQNPNTRTLLNDYLSETFVSDKIKVPETYSLLAKIPFSAALTTNFDNFLERTYRVTGSSLTPSDAEQLMSRLHSSGFFVLKLYGTIERPESVMLSPAEYEALASENIVFSRFMENLFVSKTLFFVGASLEGIEVYLKALKIGSNQLTRNHYAFVNVVGNAWKVKADILKRRYGINVISFTASPGFPEVTTFLTSLRKGIERQKGKNEPPEPLAPVLSSVELRNIGPFEELNLRLDRSWNVLLGDNGVGKSTILKALAAAFVGEDSRTYVERLIRSGATSASIALEFEGENGTSKYVTTISKSESGVIVQTTPAAPIRVNKALALGFPALRTISWDRSTESSLTGRERPLPEDLLPLIEGRPDPRLDSLRGWLISLDHVIASPDSSVKVKKRYTALRDRFFKVIEKLTPGLTVKYNGVDLESKKVLVETDDGIVPIESISQGTTSLLGWIGVFLQRYFDVYGHSTKIAEHYALVLIDEIDAHMHPRWQQLVVSNLSDLFPKVQFVATTHSPLIVAGMPSEKVFRFGRDESGRVVRQEVLPDMTVGYTEQILTSELFGLESGLDPKTRGKASLYHELLRMPKRTKKEEKKFQELEQELIFLIPPPFSSYSERRNQMINQAEAMKEVGQVLSDLGGDKEIADSILAKGSRLLTSMGAQEDDKEKV